MRRRLGFSLVELLVVIAIIGILIAMLMPAVTAARESGRRTSCSNNIRQVALALRMYEQSQRSFPPAISFPAGADPLTSTKYGPNWAILVLPYLDARPIYDRFVLWEPNNRRQPVPISDPRNRDARGAPVPILVCPTDSGHQVKFARNQDGDNWARGNYGVNGSLEQLAASNHGPASSRWTTPWRRGVMGSNAALSLDEIADGASNTILVGELRVGLSMVDRRGTWAMSAPGASSFWGHASDDAIGPNNCADLSDNILGGGEVRESVPLEHLRRECMGVHPTIGNAQATMRSRHLGGVMVSMADGSTRFISDHVEQASAWTLSLSDFRTWERLNASGDRLPISIERW